MLSKPYHLLHFFGHGFQGGIVLADYDSESKDVDLSAIRDLVKSHPTIKGVILNSCESLKGVDEAIGSFTIGMDDTIHDEQAISFAVGFYDALCTGTNIDRAIAEGKNNVKLQHNNEEPPIKVLLANSLKGD